MCQGFSKRDQDSKQEGDHDVLCPVPRHPVSNMKAE